VYDNESRWNSFGSINGSERPDPGWYEFLVMHQNSSNGAFTWFRFKQNVNPLTTDWAHTNPNNVGSGVIRIGTNGTWGAGAGMYWMGSSDCPMCFANSSNGNWWGCGIGATYQGGIPSYNNEVAKGYQLVYMRISNPKTQFYKSNIIKTKEIKEF
jgi:hypothetical protein